ncbi:DUF5946 family protein [Paenibacillus lignilyticus]|uniref:Serine/threonine protein kinase n=1 Tax=Paenibacillus lignilyticus TaxID=1172615 RepID=A0ABS5CJC3_9BACL|nr:DUF5946 family protein [Paenibacillus lignilyticus]MBP3965976.1 serine/threonine protein kinase [Paenibacillus lignilyticus]
MKQSIVKCPGCGLMLPNQYFAEPSRFHASGECMELFNQLSYYTTSHGQPEFIHQLALDAYGAQHSGGITRSITTAFSLIGLYLVVEHGFTGKQVQQAHMELGRKKITWPELTPPPTSAAITIQEVLQAEAGESRDAMIHQWVHEVWNSWSHAHSWVKEAAQPVLHAE